MANGKLWGGAFNKAAGSELQSFWSSIAFDQRLAKYDIEGSIAHAKMLKSVELLSKSECEAIVSALLELLEELCNGTLQFSVEDEDIHMNIERQLHKKIGNIAGKLHTARSRNDQVALDMHLFIKESCINISEALSDLIDTLYKKAELHTETIMPGYTHLQRAQPVSFSHHLLAYCWMFLRDIKRLKNTFDVADVSPLGAGALAGTTLPIDRRKTADLLGFSTVYQNSMDAVSNRDASLSLLMDCSMIAMHLSRFCEEVVLWTSSEFNFVSLSDEYCTGSSMMPQKKNADLAELIRGKTGRVFGNLFSLLTVLKGLPLCYNKDLQEDKEGIFDSVDTVFQSLLHLNGMVQSMEAKKENMRKATKNGFLNATDVADYLTKKDVPFREAHAIAADLVMNSIETGRTLEELSIEEYQSFSEHFESDVFSVIDLDEILKRRSSEGGTAPSSVKNQLAEFKNQWRENRM